MSRKTKFQSEMVRAVARQHGAFLTRETKERTARRFAAAMEKLGYTHLRDVNDVAGKQVRAYVFLRQEAGINVRTLQNELSHVRSMLREMGRASIADAPELSNRALGVSGGSRIGKKSAMTQGGYHAARQRAVSVGREGMASLLRLEIELGLRGNEALHARSDTLARWLHEIITSNRILVLDGTKGGRQRFVTIRDKDNALDAIREAQIIAGKQGGFLLVRSDGSPAGGLKEARQIYHSWMSRARVTPHSARYAWAQRNYLLLINSGFKEREALLTIAIELGHGSGRARWVKSTYLRELPKDLTTEQLVALLRKMVWN